MLGQDPTAIADQILVATVTVIVETDPAKGELYVRPVSSTATKPFATVRMHGKMRFPPEERIGTFVQDLSAVTTYIFTDIEGSTRLWEAHPDRMRDALARHDSIVRESVTGNRGRIVKMSGDGVHAAFADPLDAICATLQLQRSLAALESPESVVLRVRCGIHAGVDERRDNDYFGSAVNRAARIMSLAHGGQVLVSQAVAALVVDRLPAGVSLRDLGSVRLRDLASPERVHQVVHSELRSDFPALRSLEATPNNLPQQLTSFVSRERELGDIRTQLGKTRLLTLFGAGGIGKTRLSLQVAAEVLDDYPEGVWFVDFAPIADEHLVPQAIASVLGVKEEVGRPVLEALVKYISDRELLLILDNCEHLLHACSTVAAQLLRSGRHLKILASSREPLHVVAETTYHVPSLSVPEPHTAITIEALTQYEAVRLFVDRARAVQPSFQVIDANSRAVVDICRRLDGIPLALELAAARIRTLPVDEIATRLNDRFHLLTGGDHTALPRQQTLRASIDWSYDLLTDGERALLRRLAVFAGGWTLQAAEAVAPGGNVRVADVVDLLSQLVEKSLVVLEPQGERYRKLDTVREYAQERLRESAEGPDVRTRHFNFYLDLAEKARPELVGRDQGIWLRRLDPERENFLAANGWCDSVEHGASLGLKLAHALKRYWLNRGLLGLGHHISVRALARPGADPRDQARCQMLFDAGQLASAMGRYREASAHLQECLSIARDLGDKAMVAAALQPLGLAALGQGDMLSSRRHFGEAYALAHELKDPRQVAAALNALGQLDRLQGDLDSAESRYQDELRLARDEGDREITAAALLNLSMVSIGRGFLSNAQGMLLEVLAIAEESGFKPAGQSALEVCAGLSASRGDWERVARFYGAAEAQINETGLHRDPADEAFLMPQVGKARDVLGAAAFSAAENTGGNLTYEAALVEARNWLNAIN